MMMGTEVLDDVEGVTIGLTYRGVGGISASCWDIEVGLTEDDMVERGSRDTEATAS